MLKPLSLISISTIALFATTQAHSHLLCAPNTPHIQTVHSHQQSYKIPRIAVSNHNPQFLQQQRARQQKALANQQRRAQAQRRQQQNAARKAQLIRQQQLAAQQARVARQRAAQLAAAQTRYVTPAPAPVYHQTTVYTQPVVRYVQPRYIPRPVYYTPSRSHVSVSISGVQSGSDQGQYVPRKRKHKSHRVRYPKSNHHVRHHDNKHRQWSGGHGHSSGKYK